MKNLHGSIVTATALLGLFAMNSANGQVFVANSGSQYGNDVGEYSTTGTTINASLATGLDFPAGVAVLSTPEPSTYALLAGGLGLLLGRNRIRRASV